MLNLPSIPDAVMDQSSDTEYLQFWYSPLFQDSQLVRSYGGYSIGTCLSKCHSFASSTLSDRSNILRSGTLSISFGRVPVVLLSRHGGSSFRGSVMGSTAVKNTVGLLFRIFFLLQSNLIRQ